MKSIPKSLVTVRDEQASQCCVLSQDQLDGYNKGFDAGVAALLQSAELKGLVERLEVLVIENYANHIERAVLERWQEFLGEGSDEE